MYTRILILTSAFISSTALAQTGKTLDSQYNDRHTQERMEQALHPVPQPEPTPSARQTAPQETTLSLTAEQLQQHPDLIIRALAAAVLQNHAENTAFLLPYYLRLPENQHDPILIKWSEAIIAQSRQNHAEAVKKYRAVIARYPHLTLARYRLAEALFADKQWEAAEDQFKKLQSESRIAEDQIQPYLHAIRRQNRWEVSGGISYLNDRNINNAPKNRDLGGGWTAPESESGQGFNYQLGVAKQHSLGKGFFAKWQLDTDGKYYWNNPRYNELSLRNTIGLGHHNARHSITVAPFIEYIWYAGGNKNDKTLQRFSHAIGLSAQWNYQFTPKWQVSLSGETASQRYRNRTHLNGNRNNLSTTLIFSPSAKQYWFAGADSGQTKTRDKDDSYIRNAVRAGWGQEWSEGLSTRVSASYAHRNYRAAGFFGKPQRNQESSVQASVWHRNVHFFGITPRLTWFFQKTDSNLPLYTYQKHRLFIEMSKQF